MKHYFSGKYPRFTQHQISAFLFGISSLLVIFGIFLGGIETPELLKLSPEISIITGTLLCLIASTQKKPNSSQLSTYVLLGGISLYSLTGSFSKPYSFAQFHNFHNYLILGSASIIASFVATKSRSAMLIILAVITPLSALAILLYCSRSGILFSDDHSSFYYRLILLKKNFPDIPFYNLDWNSGVDAREFFPSGILNFFLLFSPLIYLFPLENTYTLLVGILLFIIAPLCHYLSVSWFVKHPDTTRIALISVILGSLSSVSFYKWALSFGTLGFVTTLCLFPFCIWGCLRLIEAPLSSRKEYFSLLIATTLCLVWPLAALAFVPLGLYALYSIKSVLKRPDFIFFALILATFSAMWALPFLACSPILSFLSVDSTIQTHGTYAKAIEGPSLFKAALNRFYELGITIHPGILLLFLPGIIMLRRTIPLFCVVSLTVWTLFLGGVATELKPQLELNRFLLFFPILGVLPTSVVVQQVLASQKKVTPSTLVVWFLLLLSCFQLQRILTNKTSERLSFSTSMLHDIAESISTYTPEGRVLFSGFMLHELDGGHIAPLAAYTTTPLIAAGFYHDKWSYTDVIPDYFRSLGPKGVIEYLNLHNVTGIVTHDSFWRLWFRKRHRLFTQVWESGRFTLYLRKKYEPSFFLQGSGTVHQEDGNLLRISLDSEQAVLKFRYHPFLTSSDCNLESSKISEDTTFIKLSGCRRSSDITIYSESIFRRILRAFAK